MSTLCSHVVVTAAIIALALTASESWAAAGGRGGGGRGFNVNDVAKGPAPTLVAPATPTAKTDEDGFIRRWAVLEPMPSPGVSQTAFHPVAIKDYDPQANTRVPRDGEKLTIDGSELTWHAYDTLKYNFNLYHFSFALHKQSGGMFWLVSTVVTAPEELKNVRLAVGSNDASVWWVNGQELIGLYNNRMDTFDDGVSRLITLKKGPNIVRAVIANEMGPSDFCARFLDAQDKPITNLTVSLNAGNP